MCGTRYRREHDRSLEIMETMCNIKEDIEIIKADNKKLLKNKEEQEEINEILLKFLTNMKQNKNMGQSISNG